MHVCVCICHVCVCLCCNRHVFGASLYWCLCSSLNIKLVVFVCTQTHISTHTYPCMCRLINALSFLFDSDISVLFLPDSVVYRYLRNVVLRFICSREDEVINWVSCLCGFFSFFPFCVHHISHVCSDVLILCVCICVCVCVTVCVCVCVCVCACECVGTIVCSLMTVCLIQILNTVKEL